MCQCIIVIIIVILIVAVMYNYREKYTSEYATLGSYGYSAPLFEPDILRRCAQGSYTYTSNPALTQFCNTVPPQVLDTVACKKIYHGRPIHLRYTSPAYADSCSACSSSNSIPCGNQIINYN
jgi:hypothetical protein